MNLRHGSLYSGIGGWLLAAEWAGIENVFSVEIDKFCNRVLGYHFPKIDKYEDIKNFKGDKYKGTIDILSTSDPCQPYSLAGKRKGTEDDRYLWRETIRVIKEIQPLVVVGENVPGILNMEFKNMLSDLEESGYIPEVFVIPACAVNAPHRRDRVWFVAHRSSKSIQQNIKRKRRVGSSQRTEIWKVNTTDGKFGTSSNTNELRGREEYELQQTKLRKQSGKKRTTSDTKSKGLEGRNRVSESIQSEQGNKQDITNSCIKGLQRGKNIRNIEKSREERNKQSAGLLLPNWQDFPTQSPLCYGNDGISVRLDNITFPKWRNESIKAMGNAIVPQIAYEIFKALVKIINDENK